MPPTAAEPSIFLLTVESSVSINLASRVFLTLGQPTPCPQCLGGTCSYGENAGQACTTTNVNQTSLDCMPGAGSFVATLPVNLTPLSTGTATQTAADGIFCIPATGNLSVDGIADLPGPGSISLPGEAQFTVVP